MLIKQIAPAIDNVWLQPFHYKSAQNFSSLEYFANYFHNFRLFE